MAFYPPLIQTSAQLAAQLSDETGSGSNVFATSPTLVTPVLGTPTSGTLINCGAATDSVAGVMSAADHTTFTSLSGQATGVAPVFVAIGLPVVGWKSGVDLKTNATVDLFTVPASRTFICLQAQILVTAVTGGASVSFVAKIIESGASGVMTLALSQGSVTPTVAKYFTMQNAVSSAPDTACAAGNKVQLSITTGFTTSTTVTGIVFVWGCYAT